MPVETEKLLALKAFYMGHAASQGPVTKSDALRMVGAALDQLQSRYRLEDQIRRAFYHLLRAEIERHGGDPLFDRMEAQRICAEVKSPLFDYFMQIEAETQGKAMDEGREAVSPYVPPVRRTQSISSGWFTTQIDLAARALGVFENELTASELKFLKRVTLKQMLERHNVEFAS